MAVNLVHDHVIVVVYIVLHANQDVGLDNALEPGYFEPTLLLLLLGDHNLTANGTGVLSGGPFLEARGVEYVLVIAVEPDH